MFDKLKDIKHFVGDNVYKCLEDALNDAKKKNSGCVFKDINIRNSIITDIEVNESVYTIKVFLQLNFKDYIINLSNGKLVPLSHPLYQKKKNYELTFTKKATVKNYGLVKKCPSCGHHLI